MHVTKRRSSKPETRHAEAASDAAALGVWVTRLAFVLALGLVLARATMLEILRDPFDAAPGGQPAPVPPGPGTSLVLDLVAWVPALLVLARAALDRSYVIRFAWTHLLLLALALWTVLSTAWASDKFSAIVSGFHLLSAAVLLWAATQLVRSWKRLRIVAGMCVALLLLHAAQALTYRFVDLPDIRKDWLAHREEHLRERGLEPGSFAAQTFESKLLRGELMGFHASPNSFAAVTVMLMVIAGGVVVQRFKADDAAAAGWNIVPGMGIVLGCAIIVWADSKTAYATPVLATCILGLLALRGNWLARHAKLAYFAGVACFVVAALAVVGHGMRHGSLVIDSLTFRWRYWVGAARIIESHPILGVGWENFGLHYLAARLPVAAEEVRDPHNFLVRFTAELGLIGGVLAVAFMLRLWWDGTRPRFPEANIESRTTSALSTIAAVVAAGFLLNALATVDFSFISAGGAEAGPAYVLLKLLERGAGAILVLVGMFSTVTRGLPEADVDERPSPWVLYGILTGLGVFLLHNLVDFSLFEAGPMFLFALLAGSALGMRDAAGVSTGKRTTCVVAVAASVAWLAAAIALAAPVLNAESDASAGEEAVRTSRFAEAIQAYQDAAASVPYNGEYSLRAAAILASARDPGSAERALASFDAAIRANPLNAAYYATRANFESHQPQPDPTRLRNDYERSLELDPENVQTRLAYARSLDELRFAAEAREQYEKALWYDDQLAPDEIERLPAAKVAEIRANIARPQGSTPAHTMPATRPL